MYISIYIYIYISYICNDAMRVMRWQRVDSLTKQLPRSLGLHYEAHTYKEYQKYVVRQTTVKPRHEIN